MIRRVTIFVLLMLLLAACGGATPAPAEPETAVSPVPAQPDTSSNAAPADLPAAAAITPANTIAEAAVIREQDWVKGGSDARVVIIEYGDFQ